MFKLIRRLFRIGKPEDKVADRDLNRKNVVEPDFIDYDGMGNQGRFPERKSNEQR